MSCRHAVVLVDDITGERKCGRCHADVGGGSGSHDESGPDVAVRMGIRQYLDRHAPDAGDDGLDEAVRDVLAMRRVLRQEQGIDADRILPDLIAARLLLWIREYDPPLTVRPTTTTRIRNLVPLYKNLFHR